MRKLYFSLLALAAQCALSAQPAYNVRIDRMPSYNDGYYYNNPGQVDAYYQQYPQNQGYQYRGYQQRPSYQQNQYAYSDNAPRNYDGLKYYQEQSNAPVERTLSIIKPDAVQTKHIGDIISRFERSGFKIVGIKMTNLSKDQAEKFYAVHKDRPFFKDLVQFMSSGPVVVMVLEGPNAIARNRQLMGATDPNKAAQGTLRSDYAESVTRNAVHGSDSDKTAQDEITFFFKDDELAPKQTS